LIGQRQGAYRDSLKKKKGKHPQTKKRDPFYYRSLSVLGKKRPAHSQGGRKGHCLQTPNKESLLEQKASRPCLSEKGSKSFLQKLWKRESGTFNSKPYLDGDP